LGQNAEILVIKQVVHAVTTEFRTFFDNENIHCCAMHLSSWLTLILRSEYCAKNATPFGAAARWTSFTPRSVASESDGRCIHCNIYNVVTETTVCVLLFV